MNSIRRIEAFDVSNYVMAVRDGGRRGLDRDTRADAVAVYRAARAARADPDLPSEHLRVARLAEAVMSAEWELSQRGGKRYLAYANIRGLNWVLGTDRRRPGAEIADRCRGAIGACVATWWAYERQSIIAGETWNQTAVPADLLPARIGLLADFATALGVATSAPAALPPRAPPTSWRDYANDPALVVEFLTTLPQTTHHDEVAFLRTIHVSECCFWGVLVWVMSAVQSLSRGGASEAAAALDRALPFADALGQTLQILQTMPPSTFVDFGGLTGDASGLQSRAYQLVQIFVFGVDQEKVAVLRAIPELRDLLFYATPQFVPLKKALSGARERGQLSGDLLAAATRLDASMYQWRARHKGVSVHYLPDQVLTGTAGRDYLARHYRHRLFDHAGGLDATPVGVGELPAPGVHARPVLSPAN